MVVIARLPLKPRNRSEISAVVFLKSNLPVSCGVDGVQAASGRTLGNGTIRIAEAADRVVERFQTHGRTSTVSVRTEAMNHILLDMSDESDEAAAQTAEESMERLDADLFHVIVAQQDVIPGESRSG